MSLAPGQTTLGALRTLIRQRCNMEVSQAVIDSEFNSYINSSYQELYGLLVQAYGNDYFVQTPYQFTTDGSSTYYPLPTDFFKMLGVDLAVSPNATQFISLKPFNMHERNKYNSPWIATSFGPSVARYRISGNNLWLMPLPQGGLYVNLIYVPRVTPLVNDSDILDGINGFEEYVVVDVCIKALAKQDLDVSVFAAQKQVQMERIKDEASNRDAGESHTVTDIYAGGQWPWGMG